MDRLKGKTILLGKEPGQGRLLLAIVGGKTAVIGSPNSVPNSVSRCRVAEGVAHAKINVDQNGNIILTNMKPQNVTFVNGSEIVSKRILLNNIVELGKDRFKINLPVIIETAKKILGSVTPPPPPPVFNIKHLKKVWEDYEYEMDRIAQQQQEIGKKRMLPIMVSSASTVLSGLGALISLSSLWVTLPVTGVVSILYFRNYSSKDTSYEDRKKANNEFQINYVCPNPACGKFHGAINYDLLKNQYRSPKDQKMYCPRCGCEYVER